MYEEPANINLFGIELTVYLTVRDGDCTPTTPCSYCGELYAAQQVIDVESIEAPQANIPPGIEILIKQYLKAWFPDRAICHLGGRCDTKGYQTEIQDMLRASQKPGATPPHQFEFLFNRLLYAMADRGDIGFSEIADWLKPIQFDNPKKVKRYLQPQKKRK